MHNREKAISVNWSPVLPQIHVTDLHSCNTNAVQVNTQSSFLYSSSSRPPSPSPVNELDEKLWRGRRTEQAGSPKGHRAKPRKILAMTAVVPLAAAFQPCYVYASADAPAIIHETVWYASRKKNHHQVQFRQTLPYGPLDFTTHQNSTHTLFI